MTGALLLGRGPELAVIARLLERAHAGRGGVLLLSGEPGIGKTALAEAAAAAAAARGFRCLWGRCWEGADAPPPWLWTQVLRSLGRDLAAGAPGDLPLPDGVGGHYGSPAAPAPLGSEPADLAARVVDALVDAGRLRPLLLLLDDLHDGSAESLQALPMVIDGLRDAPVAVLATVRGGNAQAPGVQEPLDELLGTHPTCALGGLAPADVQALLAAQGARLPAHRAAQVQEATAGNPLLAMMLARAPGSASGGEDPLAEEPGEELRAHVRRQVGGLPAATRDLLQVVAVLARVTAVADMTAAIGLGADEVRRRLAPAVADGLVDVQGEVVRLRHDVVRRCLYADLPLARREALHRAAAAALRPRAADDPQTRAEVAHHDFHGTARSTAPAALLPGLLAGAANARAAREPGEAASLLGHALACAEAAGATVADRVGILLELGDAQERAGRFTAAERTWRAATALARLSDDRMLIARVAVSSVRSALFLGLTSSVHIRSLEEALAALGEQPTPLRAEVLALLSIALEGTHERLRGRSLAEEAVRVGRAVDDGGACAVALVAQHGVTRGAEGTDRRTALAAEAVRHADAVGDTDLSVLARSLLVVDHRRRGDTRATAAAIEDLRAFADHQRHPFGRWTADVHLLVSALLAGDEERRRALAVELEQPGIANRNLARLSDFAEVMTAHGPLDADVRARVRSNARRLPHLLASRSRAALDAAQHGDPTAPEQLEAVVAALAARARTNAHWLLAGVLAAEAAALLGDVHQARTLTRLLEPRADEMVVASRVGACRGSVRHHLGVLAHASGDALQAVAHLREAARVHAASGLEALQSRTAEALARAEAAARRAAPVALVQEGAYWSLRGEDRIVTLPDLKGIRYLSRLVATPHAEVPALDLFRSDAVGGGTPAADATDLHLDAGGADPLLDASAKRAIRRQLEALDQERRRAALLGDTDRVARLDEERAAIEAALAGSIGLGGRDRRLPSELERARTSVTKAIRTVVERIREVDPGLAAHLDASLRTGARCSYAPDGPTQLTT